jgi:O-antigen/teichoic acid export membrane protein
MKFLKDAYIKNISVLFSGNLLAQLVPFMLAPIITRIFSPEELGVHGNFVALVTLISIIANGRLELAIVLPKTNEKALQILKLGLKISVLVSLISFLLIFIKAPLESFYETNLLSDFLPLVAITVLIISTHNLFIQWLVRVKLFYSISLVKLTLSLSTNLLFILLGWLKFGVSGLIYSYIIGFSFTTLILLFITKKKIKWSSPSVKTDKALLIEYREFPLINSLHAFSDILFQDFIILIIITNQFGLVTTGLFVVMMKYLKAPTRFIGSAIGQVFYPEANQSKLEKKSTNPLLIKSLKISLLAALPLLIVVLITGPNLFSWYLGNDWTQTGVFAQIMIIPIALGLLTSPISSIPLIYKKQKTSFIINFIGMLAAASTFYAVSITTQNVYYALISLAFVQSFLYLILLAWYFKLSKV